MLSFSNGFKKIDDYVSFPEYLDLSPFLSPRKEDYGLGKKRKEKEAKKKSNPREERCMYRLYGVVVHIGNMVILLFRSFSCKPC
jgi:ubiquitin carboxyl-terminal hydrolase 16/45